MENKIENIITNSLTINKEFVSKAKIKTIIEILQNALSENKYAMIATNEIDIKNLNGFKLDFNVINQIFINIKKETIYYGDIIYSERNNEKKIMYGRYFDSKGTILTINEGNTYVLLEMILRNLISNNILIINTSGYMYGTNNFLIEIIQTVLENNGYPKNQIQICVSETSEEILNHYTSLDLVICIGNHNLQRFVQNHCKNELIVSGYENFDIYLETNKYLDLINNIIKQGVSIQFYLKSNLNINIENAIIVDDIEEAVAQINFNGNGYSTAIFTEDKTSAAYFIKNIKSKIQTINTSPTIERICDISQRSLMKEKTIIYPVGDFIDKIEFDIVELLKNS